MGSSVVRNSYTYDDATPGHYGIGRLASVTDDSGSTSYRYDADGNTTRVETMIGAQTYVMEYAYDAVNRLESVTYPSGRIVEYTYDSISRLASVSTRANILATPVTLASGFSYEAFGGLDGFTYGNGITLALGDDLNGRLAAMDVLDGLTPILDLDYTYDLGGRLTGIDDADTIGGNRGRDYAYDNLHRLTQAKELAPGGGSVSLQTDYTWDAVGNRETRDAGGALETYSYDPASNRLASVLAGGVTRAFTYSDSGNVILDDAGGSATTLTYNALDRLVKVSSGAVTLVDYVYAATGQRAVKATPLATTHYLYDPGGALYAETDGAGTVLREYITLGGATIAIVNATGINYVHNDHLATPQVMTDGTAATVWDASYRPFGEATIAGAAANAQRFPGQTADPETGYSDNWYRTYDASLGRYLQSDPIGIMAGFNTYAYAGGNPIMNMDPTGQIVPLLGVIAWALAEYGVIQIVFGAWAIYEVVQIANRVTTRYQNGCRGWDLITGWEIAEIILMGKLKWAKVLFRPLKGGNGFSGFATAGGKGKPPVPTRGGGTGGPGGGGSGGGGGGLPELPDDAVVCRGGLCTADRFTNGSGVTTGPDGKLSDVSVNSAPGKTATELGENLNYGKVGTSTVGDVRGAGGSVEPDPRPWNPYHCKMCGITAEKAEELFTPAIPKSDL